MFQNAEKFEKIKLPAEQTEHFDVFWCKNGHAEVYSQKKLQERHTVTLKSNF